MAAGSEKFVKNQTHNLTGIIDWGDMHVGNPADDLQILFNFLSNSAHTLFFDNYGSIYDQTQQLALLRALYQTSAFVLYSHDIGDKDLLTESLVGLRLIANNYNNTSDSF